MLKVTAIPLGSAAQIPVDTGYELVAAVIKAMLINDNVPEKYAVVVKNIATDVTLRALRYLAQEAGVTDEDLLIKMKRIMAEGPPPNLPHFELKLPVEDFINYLCVYGVAVDLSSTEHTDSIKLGIEAIAVWLNEYLGISEEEFSMRVEAVSEELLRVTKNAKKT